MREVSKTDFISTGQHRIMKVFTVSFFGHRRFHDAAAVERMLEKIICEWLRQKEYVEFLVGRDGEFDLLVASTVRRCKHVVRNDNSSLIWVLPYATAKYQNNETAFRAYYDEIEICERSEASHYKAAFQVRNKSMVDRADFVVFCVEHSSGGAYQTLRYAQKQGKPLMNLASGSLSM